MKNRSSKIKSKKWSGVEKNVQKKALHIRKQFELESDISVRKAIKRLGIPKSTVDEIKLNVCGLKAFTKKSAPKYTVKQKKRAQKNCRKIYRNRLLSGSKKVLIMDDEGYFLLDPNNY